MIYEQMMLCDPGVNLEQVVVHLGDAPVDGARLEAAWSDAIARHDVLRLVVRADGAGMRQHIGPAFAAPLVVQDNVGDLAAFLAADRVRGVDVAVLGSWRLALLRMAGQSVLVWTFSHVMLDGRSFRLLLEEVFAQYDGGPFSVRVRPAFVDHARGIAALDTRLARGFYKAYLAGFDWETRLGFGGAALGSGTETYDAALSVAQTAALNQRAAAVGVSFANMVQAAWAVVLARVSGQGDVVFGVTRSGRYITPHAQDMLGCLITTQPLRVKLSAGLTLDALLGAVRADLIAQRPHEGLGLSDIAAVAEVPVLFDSLIMVERQSLHAALQAQGRAWHARRVELFEKGAAPLTLAAYGGACLQLRLEARLDRVTAQDARRYLAYVTHLLGAMAHATPGAVLADLVMMPPPEVACLLDLSLPVHALPQPRPPCFATAFEAVAARHPTAPALRQVGEDLGPDYAGLDYASLDARANQLAHYLAKQRVTAGGILGLCLPRGPNFVALMLAASKLGVAFLPMDPSYPATALLHMARDAQVALLLVDRDADAAWMADLPVLRVTPDLGADAPRTAPPRLGLTGDRAAYVIYTSGSTGTPKGVVVSQAALVAHGMAAIAHYGVVPGDSALQFAALSFDVALEEIVPALMAGAQVVLRSDAMLASPQQFLEDIAAQQITILNLPTGFWQVLLGALAAGAVLPASVRLVVVGGERMPLDALARWQALPGVPRLINAYGPTEATITCAAFDPVGPVAGPEVPVGRAFGHARLYVRAPDGSLSPHGAAGEVWVGGPAVANGYLHQLALTAERFLPNPDAPGRMYRTGDLGHWNADGHLVVLGRADRQIKLRGFRIEPGEVEAILERLPGVAQAHVGLAAGRLIGWLRASVPDAPPDLDVLQAELAGLLPSHKRPEMVFVAQWPQGPGGKTDVRRLPMPQVTASQNRAAGTGDAQINRIAEMFAAVLEGDIPGPDDSFFDLGGHSLQMLTLIGHIEAAFATRLTVAQVHTQPTPQGLSALLQCPVQIAPGADLVDCLMPIQPLGTGTPIYGVHVLGVNGSFFRPLAAAMGLNQPIFGLTVGLLSADTPQTVEDTARLYFRAIQAHRPEGPIGLVAVSLGSYMALELAQQLTAAGRDVRLLGLLDAAGPAGRCKIRGVAWLRAHLNLLRAGGFDYARGLILGKWDGLRHRVEKLRLVLPAQATPTSLGGFVAANDVAIQNYILRPYAGRITIIRARASVFDSAAAIANGLGWGPWAQGGFSVIDVSGDHLSILESPGVAEVAHAFTAELARSDHGADDGVPDMVAAGPHAKDPDAAPGL
jgi:amino acid adenylation domain-containing protein